MNRHKIYVINLDRDHDKWLSMRRQLRHSHIPYERFPAIDGARLPDAYKRELTTQFCYDHCTNSMIGIFLSHLAIWRKALVEDLDYVIVFEDDVRLAPHYDGKIDAYIQQNVPFDIMLLGCLFGCEKTSNPFFAILSTWLQSFDSYSNMDRVPTPTSLRADSAADQYNDCARYYAKQPTNSAGIHRVDAFTGTHAYIASRCGLKKLVAMMDKASYHLDISISNKGIRIYKAPTIAYQDDFERSSNVELGAMDTLANQIRYNNVPLSWLYSIPLMKAGHITINLKTVLICLFMLFVVYRAISLVR